MQAKSSNRLTMGGKGTDTDFINNSLNELGMVLTELAKGNVPVFRGDMGNMLLRALKLNFTPNSSFIFVVPISPVEQFIHSNLYILDKANKFKNIQLNQLKTKVYF